jgi:hypothetical protein
MIILEQPYVSEFLIDSIVNNDWQVLNNDSLELMHIEPDAIQAISSEDAKNYYQQFEYPLIYSNSENSINWVLENLPNSKLSGYIKLFKDKIEFRKMLQELYPDFYFKEIELDGLKRLKPNELKFPLVLKPSIGFLSLGVHTIYNLSEWSETIKTLDREMSAAQKFYPKAVVNSSKFIIEEFIDGKEFAVDAYYDKNGVPVILNMFQHPFLNSKDVRDRIYLMSKQIMIQYMSKVVFLLKEIGDKNDIRNFPMHIELRITDDGQMIPIEVNPMRFAGWCTTDVAHFAWGLNVYEYFMTQSKPDWNAILSNASDEIYYFSMAEVPQGFNRNNFVSFDYSGWLSNYSNVLEVRKINPLKHPLFAVIFGSTKNPDEIQHILSIETKNYVK